MLRKYIAYPSHVLEAPLVELKQDLSFNVQLMVIVDQKLKELRNKVILMVKVLWKSDTIEEMTWETKASMRSRYLYLFSEVILISSTSLNFHSPTSYQHIEVLHFLPYNAS